MEAQAFEKPALLIIDMVKDNLDPDHPSPLAPFAMQIVPPLNDLIKMFRAHSWPVVFATDAFHEDDFIFTGRMKPHSLAGTQGAEIADALDYRPQLDTWLPKPRFSAFFQTGLEKLLHRQEITLCAVGGIATNYCVLATVMDALCHDFKAVLLEDCSASFSESTHRAVIEMYRKNPLFPLLRVGLSTEMEEVLC